ncbi:hypothetical protein CUT44_01960 [Streptomyces carminius]|uniref:Uncharacterized protein n=1 Tax=Streptomyces carminius TaxID=2665496 RepID=A0A2M8M1E8_9ACTN|nr:hypothetical protein [Streptomyces carminius]PJE98031.1 hypothetical protein CUT44_10220 [Streptomyces carminius]PJF01857.1 hypothetical protein CUT44_01960 [Streptomyces carminius]
MSGITVGKPDVRPDRAAHVRGVRQGNELGSYEKSPGHLPDDRSTARRSTGIDPGRRDPILPEMPNLSPP